MERGSTAIYLLLNICDWPGGGGGGGCTSETIHDFHDASSPSGEIKVLTTLQILYIGSGLPLG